MPCPTICLEFGCGLLHVDAEAYVKSLNVRKEPEDGQFGTPLPLSDCPREAAINTPKNRSRHVWATFKRLGDVGAAFVIVPDGVRVDIEGDIKKLMIVRTSALLEELPQKFSNSGYTPDLHSKLLDAAASSMADYIIFRVWLWPPQCRVGGCAALPLFWSLAAASSMADYIIFRVWLWPPRCRVGGCPVLPLFLESGYGLLHVGLYYVSSGYGLLNVGLCYFASQIG